MNSSRYSRLLLVLVALLLSAGVVTGVSVSQDQGPSEAEVGRQVEASYTLTQLYQEPSYESWTLQAQTEMVNVTWTFQLVDQAGNVVETQNVDGQQVSQPVSIDDGVDQVRVAVVGEVPEIQNYTYDPPTSFLVAGFVHAREGGTSQTIEVFGARSFTEESEEARVAIADAESAIEAAGGNAEAEATLGNAISAYEAENFDNAINLAEQAEQRAQGAQQTQQRNQLIVYGVIALVVIGLLVGAVLWYRSRQSTSRL